MKLDYISKSLAFSMAPNSQLNEVTTRACWEILLQPIETRHNKHATQAVLRQQKNAGKTRWHLLPADLCRACFCCRGGVHVKVFCPDFKDPCRKHIISELALAQLCSTTGRHRGHKDKTYPTKRVIPGVILACSCLVFFHLSVFLFSFSITAVVPRSFFYKRPSLPSKPHP